VPQVDISQQLSMLEQISPYIYFLENWLYIGLVTAKHYKVELTPPLLAEILVHHVLEGQFRVHRATASHTVSVSDFTLCIHMTTRLIPM
jgi:hypothetical protein